MASNGNKAAASAASLQYQKLTQLEHVLKRPDTYIGSVEFHQSTMWVCNDAGQMEHKEVSFVPGLYKIFDEILVNAADNKVRDPSMKSIKVNIDPEKNEITVKNDGKGIPIEIHDKEKIYIPELIFGYLLTSSNYNDEEQKITGGRNGFGAKLCNIFSTKFVLETADKKNVYRQEWTNNMTKVEKPTILKNPEKKSYTCITFCPDLAKFGMDHLDADVVSVLRRRVYDLAGTTHGVTVSLNDQVIPMKDFREYVNLYVKALNKKNDEEAKVLYVKPNDRWEVAFTLSENQFNQMSFVNSIATTSGGTHVNYVVDQIVNYAIDHVNKKTAKGRGGRLQKVQVKGNIFIFINCKINNPSFTSQTKEQLTSKVSSFGSKCELPPKFLKDILDKTSFVDRLLAIADVNADKELKKSDGGKKRRLTEFVKLEDANKAGTKDSSKCTLILTEGDSAKALAVAGLAVIGRDYYGCFPLRGKLLNVRDASADQINKNAEINALKQIIGLQHKKHYTSTQGLRYGHIMIMTDQDHDGSHIKGLIINFLESSFPGLLDIPGFLLEFITPIVKVSLLKGKKVAEVIPFYTMPEYEAWRDTEGKTCKWTQKYYKGLGSSNPQVEGREYFNDIKRHEKTFSHLQEGDKEKIELAFSKYRADDRKKWLQDFKPGTYLDSRIDNIPIKDFIDKELVLFSMADNLRSIPSVVDGLKPSQRKVLYGCFLRKLYRSVLVYQLGGYILDKANYHHGDQSLCQTIVSLAQDFVGANNIYYLLPDGGFGSRAMGGKDASAARYISTRLNPLTEYAFHKLDAPLLNYLQDDDSTVEPDYYVPILPTLLVNGAEGIGTGWSTTIPSYNPEDIVANLRRMMKGEKLVPLVPWFRGWSGVIEKIPGSDHQYRVCGRIEEIDDQTLAITELPVKMWTQTMKEFLLKSIIGASKDKDKKLNVEFIEDLTEEHGSGVRFIVKLSPIEMEKAKKVGLYNKFKLIAPLSTSNMVAFDPHGQLRRYESPEEILKEFYHVRRNLYQKRKDYIADDIRNQLEKLSAQARFIKMIVEGTLVVANKRKRVLEAELRELRFPLMSPDGKIVPVGEDHQEVKIVALDENDDDDDHSDEDEAENTDGEEASTKVYVPKAPSYDYILKMAILSLTKERYERLLNQQKNLEDQLNEILKKSITDLWNEDLDIFLVKWHEFLKQDTENRENLLKPDQQSAAKKRKAAKQDTPAAKKARTRKAPIPSYAEVTSTVVPLPSIEESVVKPKVKREPKAPAPIKVEPVSDVSTQSTAAPSETVSSQKSLAVDVSKKDTLSSNRSCVGNQKTASQEAISKTSKRHHSKTLGVDGDELDASVPASPRKLSKRSATHAVEVSDVESGEDADDSVFMLTDDSD